MSYDPKKIYAVLHKNKVFVLRKVTSRNAEWV